MALTITYAIGSELAVTAPARSVGDLLLVNAEKDAVVSAGSYPTPSGWTRVDFNNHFTATMTEGQVDASRFAFYRTATGTSADNWLRTKNATDGGTGGNAMMVVCHGDFGAPTLKRVAQNNGQVALPNILVPAGKVYSIIGQAVVAAGATVAWTFNGTVDRVFINNNTSALLYDVSLPAGSATGPNNTGLNRTIDVGTTGGAGSLILWELEESLNQAPFAPTPTAPVNNSAQDRAFPIRLAATFNDPDAGDSVSQSDWRYRIVGAATWTTVFQGNGLRFLDIAAGLAAGNYEWQVRYYDSSGAVSPYSASSFFTSGNAPVGPSITAPLTGAVLAAPAQTVTWTSSAQDAFQIQRVADNAGLITETVYFDTGTLEGPSNAAARSYGLLFNVNGRFEHVRLRTRSGGLWSPWDSERVQVSFTPPAAPTLALTAGVSSILVAVTNTPPGGGQPVVVWHDVYVRASGNNPTADQYRPFTDDGTPVRRQVPVGGSWRDERPAAGVDYEYRAVSIANNGTSSSSPWTGAAVTPLAPGTAVSDGTYTSTYQETY